MIPLLLAPEPPAIVLTVQVQVPQVGLAVDVVGMLPVQAKLTDLSRRLALRQQAPNPFRRYPPTILELIRLVERNPTILEPAPRIRAAKW